jgi:N-acetylglucosamine-6-phosphate deacetylase
VNFSAATLTHKECFEACELLLAEGGCAAIVPTVITAPTSTFEHVLPILADACDDERFGGRLLGIHMEGPFISPKKGAVGTHPAKDVIGPDDGGCALLDEWQRLARGHIKMITIAAEAEGAAQLCAHAVSVGIRVSLGHQLATRPEINQLAGAGATLLTHLGNGCPNLIHRHDNHLWPSLSDDRLTAMLISDGQHLPADALTTMVRAKGIGRTLITSDCSPVAGLPEGIYDCFGSVVHVEGPYVRSADKSCLAGSGSLMIDCMNHLASLSLRPHPGDERPLSLAEMLELSFSNPLRALGLDPAQMHARLAQRGARVHYTGGEFHKLKSSVTSE